MKILMTVVSFAPRAGGLEVAVELLSRGMVSLGHQVRVATLEASSAPDDFPFEVIRRPTFRQMMESYRWCDIMVVHGQSGWFGWQAMLGRRPAFVVCHNILSHTNPDTQLRLGVRIRRVMRSVVYGRCQQMAASQAIAADVGPGTISIHVPYDHTLFRTSPNVIRDRDFIFIGRYVKLKGMSDLVEAVNLLRSRGRYTTATFIGVGPEEDSLRELVRAHHLEDQILVLGRVPRADIPTYLSQHRVIVVPSRCAEGFGIVAMEGIACGCVAVGSESGGLPEAIGPCGLTFRNTDVADLADKLELVVKDSVLREQFLAASSEHLAKHRPDALAAQYVREFEARLSKSTVRG